MVRNRQSRDLYRDLRERMIRETQEFLEESLGHAEQIVRIPTVVAGRAVFTPYFARAYWNEVLGLSAKTTSLVHRVSGTRFDLSLRSRAVAADAPGGFVRWATAPGATVASQKYRIFRSTRLGRVIEVRGSARTEVRGSVGIGTHF